MSRKNFYLDLLERLGWTFVIAAASELIVSQSFDLRTLKYAATAGGLSALKSLGANQLPWTASNSASTLPAGD